MGRLIFALAVISSLCACAPNGAEVRATASGRPEVTVAKIDRSAVKSKLANFYVNLGYTLKSSDDMSVTFDKQSANIGAGILLTCGTCYPPRSRLTFSILDDGKRLRIVADHVLVANEGTPAERRVPSMSDYVKVLTQKELDELFPAASS